MKKFHEVLGEAMRIIEEENISWSEAIEKAKEIIGAMNDEEE